MAINAQAISQAVQHIRSVTGMNVRYAGGQWFVDLPGEPPATRPATGEVAATLNSILNQYSFTGSLNSPSRGATQAFPPGYTPRQPPSSFPAGGLYSPTGTLQPTSLTPPWQNYPGTFGAPAPGGPAGPPGGGSFSNSGAFGTVAAGAIGTTTSTVGGSGNNYLRFGAMAFGIVRVLRQIEQAGQVGAGAGSAIGKGITSALTDATKAGTQLAQAVIAGILQPFGATGKGIANIAGAAGHGLTGVVSGIGTLATAGLRAAGGVAGLGLGAAGAGIGAVVGGSVGGPTGAIAGAYVGSALATFVARGLEAIAQLFGGVIEGVGKLAGAFGELVTGVLQNLVDITRDLVNTITQYAGEVSKFSLRTGTPLGVANQAAQAAGAFGISRADALGGDQEYFLRRMTARGLLGVSGEPGSFDELRQIRATLGSQLRDSGPGGLPARTRIRAAGPYYEQALESGALTVPNDVFERQASRSQNMQGALGLSPEKIQQVAQNFNLLIASAEQFVELLKIKFADTLIPIIGGLLDKAIDYVSKNADQIGAYVIKAANYYGYDLPVAILKGVQVVLTGLGNALISLGAFGHGVADFVRGLDSGVGGIGDAISNVLGYIDPLINGMTALGQAMSLVGGIVETVVGLIVASTGAMSIIVGEMLHGITSLGSIALHGLGLGWLGDIETSLSGVFLDAAKTQTKMGADWFTTGSARVAGALSNAFNTNPSNLQGTFNDMRNRTANGRHDFAAAIDRGADSITGAGEYLKGTGVDKVQGIIDLLKVIHDAASQTANNTKATADNTDKTAQNIQPALLALMGRVAANFAEDTHFQLSRIPAG